MNTFTITLERISTGAQAPSLLHRCETEAEARAYAQSVIDRQFNAYDLHIVEITSRPA